MTKAIILAEGRGNRLSPLTKNKPKCLIKFLGKSLLDYQIEALLNNKIHDIHVVSGYLQKKIINKNVTKSVNKNYNKSNMVNSFFSCMKILNKKEDILIIYGDIIFTKENLKKVIDCKEDVCVMIDKNYLKYWKKRMKNPLDDLESLVVNEEGFIKEIGKKTENYKKIQGQFTGLLKFNKRVITKLKNFYNKLDKNKTYDKQNFDNMYMTSFIQLLIEDNWKVKSVNIKNDWLEFDTIKDFELYNKLYNSNQLKKIISLDTG